MAPGAGGDAMAPGAGPSAAEAYASEVAGSTSLPVVSRAAASVQVCSSATTVVALVGGQVERGEIGVLLRRRDDAGLMRAPERLGGAAWLRRGGLRHSGAGGRSRRRAAAASPPAAASKPRRDGRRRAVAGSSVSVPPSRCSCRPRHNRSPCRPASWRCRTGRRCRAATAPGWCRSTARRSACRLAGSTSTTWPLRALQASR